MIIKSPIYLFGGLVFLFGLFVLFFVFGFWGIYAVLYLYGSYAILMGMSFILKKLRVAYRSFYEIGLIIIHVSVHTLYYLHWDVGSELYFEDNQKSFVGKDQHFIIAFGIEGQPKLQDNIFTDNEIYIPESGILLTASDTESLQHRFRFDDKSIGDRFYIGYFEQCECYGKANHKFNYVVGAINDSAEISPAYKDSLLGLVCQRLNTGEIMSNLAAGYEQGTYLDQTEVIINGFSLTTR